jgi:flagellar motor switch protein FliM
LRKSLDQSEMDALYNKAQASRQDARGNQTKAAVPCDLRRSSQLTRDQVAALTTLHEPFARRLSNSLGVQLRVAIEVNLVSVEQLIYKDLLARLPDPTYFASAHLLPIDARAAMQLDLNLAYPMVDVILGGSGLGTVEMRDLTEIEEQILETVFRSLLSELQSTWAPVLELDFQFEQRQRSMQMQNTMLSGEKVLCLGFGVHLAESTGALVIVFPAVIASALLRRLAAHWSRSERIPSRDSRRRMREHLLGSRFTADLSLPVSRLAVRHLLNLEVGQVLMLSKQVRDPIYFNIAGRPMYLAYPVRQGSHRGARIDGRTSASRQASKQQVSLEKDSNAR